MATNTTPNWQKAQARRLQNDNPGMPYAEALRRVRELLPSAIHENPSFADIFHPVVVSPIDRDPGRARLGWWASRAASATMRGATNVHVFTRLRLDIVERVMPASRRGFEPRVFDQTWWLCTDLSDPEGSRIGGVADDAPWGSFISGCQPASAKEAREAIESILSDEGDGPPFEWLLNRYPTGVMHDYRLRAHWFPIAFPGARDETGWTPPAWELHDWSGPTLATL